MIQQEKAKDLIQKFGSKELALICIDEIEQEMIDYGVVSDQLQNMDSFFRYLDGLRNILEI